MSFSISTLLATNNIFLANILYLEYKSRAKRVQITDICTRLIPPGRVKFKTLANQSFGRRNRWIIILLLDGALVCSIDVYFLRVVCDLKILHNS